MRFTKEQLAGDKKPREYPREAREAAFLLGGIGTGNVSLGSRGDLRDWEIFNRPGKGNVLPNSYFVIWTKPEGGEPLAKVLESKLLPPHGRANGYAPETGAGLPRLDASQLIGEYPLAKVQFQDAELPLEVELEAFTPFLPLNDRESSIPGAYLTYRVRNPLAVPVEITLAGSLCNPSGIKYDGYGSVNYDEAGGHLNELRESDYGKGLFLHSKKFAPEELSYGDMTMLAETVEGDLITSKPAWYRGGWFDFLQEFWDDFKKDGLLNDLKYDTPYRDGHASTGTIGIRTTLAPGESRDFRFVLAWHFPNRINGWNENIRVKVPGRETIRNYYATLFSSSWEAASYMAEHRERLERVTRTFHDTLYSTTIPRYALDVISANLTTIRSQTCFRLEDGRFLAYEGCLDNVGSCEGNCTHVWNYSQAMAFLFPNLERSMRRTELLDETNAEGQMSFRAYSMFEHKWRWFDDTDAPPAVDGQLGSVLRLYREWQLGADDEWLRQLWEPAKRCLSFAAANWDPDGDGLLEAKQHNTYDIEFYGPNPLTGFIYIAALRAATRIADHLGETKLAREYEATAAKSSTLLDTTLWNGEYYEQRLDDVNAHKYQHGAGCLSDQVFGQQLAHVYGLGYLAPKEHIQSAVAAIYKHNYKHNFEDVTNCQRTYVLNDESGLVLCSWPKGGRPNFPFIYSDEVWTGIEYHVATHLIYEGFIEEGLTIVRTVWERQDGYRRNPWNDIECGHHYARGLSSWGLLLAFSGFHFDMPARRMSFAPPAPEGEEFRTFWSTGTAWGTYRQFRKDTGEWEPEVEVLEGDLTGVTVSACGKEWVL